MLGVAFLVPFMLFAVTRQIARPLVPRLLGIFVLGGLQGGMGWYMVKSGMVDRPDVSQYRLVAHLALALVLYGYLFRLALGLWRGAAPAGAPLPAPRWLAAFAHLLVGIVFLTILSGGFVAGLNAGFAYNTFPLMDGKWVPDNLALLSPPWRNAFESLATVQFDHRLLATTTAGLVVLLWFAALAVRLCAAARRAVHGLLAAVIVQFGLGVATLLLVVPVPLGVAHQGGAVLLFTAGLWAGYELSRRPPA
jgi:cytochrome c oxidase assembly protein subunit 15